MIRHKIGDPVILRQTVFSGTITRIHSIRMGLCNENLYSAKFRPNDFYDWEQFMPITEEEFTEYSPTCNQFYHPKTQELLEKAFTRILENVK